MILSESRQRQQTLLSLARFASPQLALDLDRYFATTDADMAALRIEAGQDAGVTACGAGAQAVAGGADAVEADGALGPLLAGGVAGAAADADRPTARVGCVLARYGHSQSSMMRARSSRKSELISMTAASPAVRLRRSAST